MEPQRAARCRLLSQALALASLLALAASSPILTQAKEMDTDRPGSDYKNILLDADFCENECKKDSNCKAWTYVKPGTIQGPDARCWLKSSVPAPINNKCCISGFKSALPAISTTGDLAASDWCFSLNQAIGKITFYPIVKNVGPAAWASAKEGEYQIGVGKDGVFQTANHKLHAFPLFWLEKDASATLEGITKTFYENSTYNLDNLWVVAHSEDTNPNNNVLGIKSGPTSGKAFLPNGTLSAKVCK